MHAEAIANVDKLKPKIQSARQSNYPRDAARHRAPVIIASSIPECWSAEDIQWTLAQIAATKGISAVALGDSVSALTDGRYRRSESSDHQLRTDVQKFKDLHIATEGRALSAFLLALEEKVLIENLPNTLRRALIREWVAKVQIFWSKGRCALLKSATTTSNAKWLWFRSLLGRVVVDGKWKDHEIDGMMHFFELAQVSILFNISVSNLFLPLVIVSRSGASPNMGSLDPG